MTLIKWNPINALDYYRDFDSIFNNAFRHFPVVSRKKDGWLPRIDVVEKDKEYNLIAELPGMNKKDINITIKDDVLTISGEKAAKEAKDGKDHYICERRFGKFERLFRLTDKTDEKNIRAEYKNGILTVSIPKIEKHEPESMKIEIK